MDKLKEADLNSEQMGRRIVALEEERDEWEKKCEEFQSKYEEAQKELDEIANSLENL